MAETILFLTGMLIGVLLGHYEGCRCLCPKRPYPWLRASVKD